MKEQSKTELLNQDWEVAKDRIHWQAKRAFIQLSIGAEYQPRPEVEHKRLQLI